MVSQGGGGLRRTTGDSGRNARKWVRIAAACFLILVGGEFVLLIAHWPFRRSAVVTALEKASAAKVEIGSFRRTYFPFPGCVASHVIIHRAGDSAAPPLITIETLQVEADYYRIVTFSKDLRSIGTEGMRIHFLEGGQRQSSGKSGSKVGASIQVDEIFARRTVLQFDRAGGKEPFVIQVHNVRLAPVSGSKPLDFQTDLALPEPPSEVHVEGRFGPWSVGDPFATPVSGSYSLQHADLAFAKGIGGLLDSTGRFRGTIRGIAVEGSLVAPGFLVRSAHHPVRLTAAFRGLVNGQTGNVTLQSVDTHFQRSAVTAAGEIAARSPQSGKVVAMEMKVPEGRIEDFLRLLTSGSPGLAGNMTVSCRAVLPPGPAEFLKKLRIEGTFRIARARFTRPQTQANLDRLSRRTRGEKDDSEEAPDVLSNLWGAVSLANGTARVSSLTFEVPGAVARLSGTYDLVQENVDLHGLAHLQAPLSKTTKGVKSFLLKIIEPFVQKRRGPGADVPIKLTGHWGHASLGLDLKGKR